MSGRAGVDSPYSPPPAGASGLGDLNQRQAQILEAVRANGAVAVSELAGQFDVTTQTIRRDLKVLGERGLLVKGFGGAFASPGVARYTYSERHSTEIEIKRGLVEALRPLLFNGATIFVGLGTTFHALHSVIADFPGTLIASPNLEVIYNCALHTDATVYVFGGYVRNKDTSILTLAGGARQKFKFDLAIIGASAVDRDGAVLEFDPMEVELTREILEQSRKVALVVHEGKFDRKAPHLVTHLRQVDYLVTNVNPAGHFDDPDTLASLEVLTS
ncbi:MAG: DeoR/GlpR transcriptional regulator [Devosia sp.]|uniref:DeoR/GlpR family DNA-binding transcription regulator n=1 Tax=Devosia sp. TaxID=1871048 RepID=UPI0024CD7533|nr:DeoR/GlpR family DNA-binding transcription regulator [Devosia sp.]UYN99374.1 MAG: DeoR/GlpR transcriptional regulator [Devosia sp.]